MAKKKKKFTDRDIVNWWLWRFFETTLDVIESENPDWVENPQEYNTEFFDKYQVTQEQYDEWYRWMMKTLIKDYGTSTKKSSWAITLTCAPIIKYKK